MTGEAQSSDAVLLVRPAAFGFHAEAAESNLFAGASNDPEVAARAMREFEGLRQRLGDAGVEVLILDDSPEPAKPDAIFPNNWVSFHSDGTAVLYPMATAARRLERNPEGLAELLASSGFEIRRLIDFSSHEQDGRFLEGTGSLVLDRPRRRAYASLSPRTDPSIIGQFDERLGYSTLVFDARDRSGRAIYHTNVLLSLGTRFAALCVEAVAPEYRDSLVADIEASGRTLVEVDYDQLRSFACNLIELRSASGEPLIALSSAALRSLRAEQVRALEKAGGALVDAPIPTIEAVGGGSVRCMIADVHLPRLG
ncbi:MAG: arginine deiminase-related protein [Sphingomicrobium sp.]